jgi:hypothetical protein
MLDYAIRRLIPAVGLFAGLMLLTVPATAQFNGHNLRGDWGLMSATQPDPGFYAGLLYAQYGVNELRDSNGDKLPTEGSLNVNAIAPYLWWVSNFEILGANYSIFAGQPWLDNALEAPTFGTSSSTGLGFGDLYVQPVNLGWHTERADFMAGIGFYAPTGRYEDGGDDNTGLGMWSFELSGGTTVYFDKERTWHLSALAAWETHTEKEDSDARVGDLLTIEGGLGKSWMDGALSVGVAYFAQWKLTHDDPGTPLNLIRPDPSRHKIFGVGPEVVLPLATKNKFYGSVALRYLWDFGVENNTQGQTFVVMATFPIPSVPLQ